MATRQFEEGDKVAYSVQFLKSIGMSHSDMAQGRGVVIAVKSFGERRLVSIQWIDADLPAKVIDANLAHVGPNAKFCQC